MTTEAQGELLADLVRRLREPRMTPVTCPACAGPATAAIIATVPADLPTHDLIRFEDRRSGDRLYVCADCGRCGQRWCVRLLRRAA